MHKPLYPWEVAGKLTELPTQGKVSLVLPCVPKLTQSVISVGNLDSQLPSSAAWEIEKLEDTRGEVSGV